MRVFAVSDLHSDFRENWALLEAISETDYRRDVLIVAGDIAHQITRIEQTLTLLRSRFAQLFYLPGNHELWVRGEYQDSIEKFNAILELCRKLEVRTAPGRAGPIWIVPLFSWYDESLEHGDSGYDEELEAWGDFRFCRWPEGLGRVADYMLELNVERIRSYEGPVVSFSHFLPRRELLPPTDVLVFKGLPSVAGSISLDKQIRALSPEVHVFGHSHINCDKVIDGVRYVQNALLYPREREALTNIGRIFWKGGGPLLQVAATSDE